MLKSLQIKNFTVFSKAEFDFSPGLNVIIGANGLGKSHLLKLGYAVNHALNQGRTGNYTKQSLQKRIADKLVATFRPDSLGRLTRRGNGLSRAEIQIRFHHQAELEMGFSFGTNSKSEVTLDEFKVTQSKAKAYQGEASAIFFPTKEVISMYPGFAALYRDYHMEIDEAYYDLCLALERPLLRGPRSEKTKPLLEPLEKILGGTVLYENRRFLLRLRDKGKMEMPLRDKGKMEMPLVAEGMRKLASLAYLIANGSVTDPSTLYWDEPETNLNPLLIAKLAEILVKIATQGMQVIIATHSLFLMKELDLQLKKEREKRFSLLHDPPVRFFALSAGDAGVIVQAKDSIEDVAPITALDAEIEQSERYEESLIEKSTVGGKRNA